MCQGMGITIIVYVVLLTMRIVDNEPLSDKELQGIEHQLD